MSHLSCIGVIWCVKAVDLALVESYYSITVTVLYHARPEIARRAQQEGRHPSFLLGLRRWSQDQKLMQKHLGNPSTNHPSGARFHFWSMSSADKEATTPMKTNHARVSWVMLSNHAKWSWMYEWISYCCLRPKTPETRKRCEDLWPIKSLLSSYSKKEDAGTWTEEYGIYEKTSRYPISGYVMHHRFPERQIPLSFYVYHQFHS